MGSIPRMDSHTRKPRHIQQVHHELFETPAHVYLYFICTHRNSGFVRDFPGWHRKTGGFSNFIFQDVNAVGYKLAVNEKSAESKVVSEEIACL
jgi:hypothetical protein